jgi:energy-converting hydrogenase Eha subunit A
MVEFRQFERSTTSKEANMATRVQVAGPRSRWFYVFAAALIAAIIFAGFSRTFYLNSYFAKLHLPTLLLIHGIVFTSWILLLIVQTSLVAADRTDIHRQLGVLGGFLAALMVVVGMLAAIYSGRRGFTPPNGPPPLVFLSVPVFDLVVFSSLVAAGLYYRNKPDTHKRLMLLSTLGILGPGVARLPIGWISAHGLPAIFGIQDAVLVLCIAYDTAIHRRLHRAFLWGGLWIILSLPLRMAVASTTAWTSFAHWLIR